MPKTDSITIPITVLDNIMQLLAENNYAGHSVIIADTNNVFSIRDINGMLIGNIAKPISDEQTH